MYLEKKNNEETLFVLAEQTPEGYDILGIFKSIDKVIEAFNQNEKLKSSAQSFPDFLQIEEVPIDTMLSWKNSKNPVSKIAGSVRSYDLKGNLLK